MNRFTTIVASLAAICLTATLSFAGPTPPKGTEFGTSRIAQSSESLSETAPAGPTFAPAAKPGDLNGDGLVNVDDMLIITNSFGTAVKGTKADITKNGVVDIDDLLVVLMNWGA